VHCQGAIGMRFLLDQSSFCFLNCHLAAGQTNVPERNADMATIVRDIEFPPVTTSRGTVRPIHWTRRWAIATLIQVHHHRECFTMAR